MKLLHHEYEWRFWFVVLLLSLSLMGVIWRMIDLTVMQRQFLLNQGDARIMRTVELPAYRGMITDRNGEPLAISTPVKSVWVDPRSYQNDHQNMVLLSKLIGVPVASIEEKIEKNKNREFLYLQRQINPAIAEKIKALNIPGIFLNNEYRRFYPTAQVSAQVIGINNIDDQGQEGLELFYNDWLQGVPGKKRVMKDRLGRIVADVKTLQEPQPGHDLVLSIDSRIQYLAYRELEAAVQISQAESGSIVVLDVQTGEVLAMVNQPSFNPNKRVQIGRGLFRNRAVTDIFEPGSTMKPFSVANALQSGKYQPSDMIDTSPGWMNINGNTVRDMRDNGRISITDILRVSSNIGVSKLTLSLAPASLWQFLQDVGIGQSTEIGFPGESSGTLLERRVWPEFALATLSFGYGLAMTNIQLARAYAALASGGLLRPTSLLKQNVIPKGKRVMSEGVASTMLNQLRIVAQEGTARRAKIPNYSIGGKTGTTRMIGPNGYEKNRHVAMFVGIAPISQPRLVISVVISDPKKGSYYGGTLAAPVFGRIMSGALRILDIPPDNA